MLTPENINMILIVVAAVAGLLIGVLIARLANKRREKTLAASPEMKQEGYTDIARLWYSPATKRIITEMGSEFHKEFSGMNYDTQKKALRLAELFADWVRTSAIIEEKPADVVIEQLVESEVESPSYRDL